MNQDINRQNSVRKIRDRYKPLFCLQDFYEKNQKHFANLATKIVAGENTKPDQIEKFIVTTLILSLLRRPENWYGGLRKNDFSDSHQQNSFLSTAKMKHFTDSVTVKWPRTINPDISVYEFINSVKIKSIPEKVFWSLHFLSQNKNRFLISRISPSPYELLSIQAQGQRVITFEDNYSVWNKLIYEHRDVLSFWLHDLVHAAEFFQNEEQQNHQINFYRWIELLRLQSSREDFWSAFLTTEKNRTRFEYLISDMNSHPLHLIKTFRAILDEADPKYWLEVHKATEELLSKHQNKELLLDKLECLLRVNSPEFAPFHYDAMLHILSCINSIWVLSNKPVG